MNKFIYTLIAAVSLSLFSSCDYEDDFENPNYVSFSENSANVGVDVGGSSTYDVTVYAANVTGADRQVGVVVEDATTLAASGYTVPSTVTIPAGSNEAVLNVEVSDVDLGLTGKSLVLSLQEDAALSTGENLEIGVNRTCVGKEFVVDFVFDGYASETSWSIADADGNVLVSVPATTYDDGTETASRSLCLSQGDYTFTVGDSFGDGLTYPNLGSVTLSYAGTVLTTIDGAFDEGTSVEVSF